MRDSNIKRADNRPCGRTGRSPGRRKADQHDRDSGLDCHPILGIERDAGQRLTAEVAGRCTLGRPGCVQLRAAARMTFSDHAGKRMRTCLGNILVNPHGGMMVIARHDAAPPRCPAGRAARGWT
jgi:hypothetical protein